MGGCVSYNRHQVLNLTRCARDVERHFTWKERDVEHTRVYVKKG